MLRLLPVLLILSLALFALVDCIARDDDEIRGLPKVLWVLVILLFPLLGSVAWFVAGRPHGAALPGVGTGSAASPDERRFNPFGAALLAQTSMKSARAASIVPPVRSATPTRAMPRRR